VKRPPFGLVLRAFLLRELREAASYKAAFVLSAGGLMLALGAIYYLSRFVSPQASPQLARYGSSYLGFIIIGFILTELQQVAIGSFARRIRTAQLAGTLEAMLATPVRPWQILLSAPIGDFLEALARAVGYLLLARLGFGLRLSSARFGAALLVLLLAMSAFVGLGLLAAAATMFLRKGEPIGWAISGLSVLVSGVIYPTAVLPGWLRTIGDALPITHALEGVRRALLGGAGLGDVARSVAALGTFCALLVPLGLAAFATALRRARIDGSLTHY
jgi:ABC-2 type transport system permease protein